MSIIVAGILPSPMNVPMANTLIRVTAMGTSTEVVNAASKEFRTDAQGNYSFPLLTGLFEVEVNYSDEYHEVGTFIVGDDTPTPITISELLRYTLPNIPAVIIDTSPEWEALYNNLINDVDTYPQESQEQIADGETLASETKQIWFNSRLGARMSDESLDISTGVAKVVTQPHAYEDDNLNQSATHSTALITDTVDGLNTIEVYKASNGDVAAKHAVTFITPLQTTEQSITIDGGEVTQVNNITLPTSESKVGKTLTDSGYTEDNQVDVVEGVHSSHSTQARGIYYGYQDEDDVTVDGKFKVDIVDGIELKGTVNSETKTTHTISENGTGGTVVKDEHTTDVGSKSSRTTQTNNGLITRKELVLDEFIVSDGTNEIMKVDTDNAEVTLNARLVINNPDDFKGRDGDTRFEVYLYSSVASDDPEDGNWHTVFNSADIYRITNWSINGVIDPNTWTSPAKLSGIDGAPGDTEFFDYDYSVDGLSDWHDILVDGDLWRRERQVTNGNVGSWSAPARIAGTDGADGEILAPAYQYSIDGLEIWHSNFSTGDHYRRERLEYFYNAQDLLAGNYYLATPWSSAAKLVPIKGVDYDYKNATVYLYQRDGIEPVNPTGTVTYDFLTLALTGDMGNWETTIPSGNNDLWVAVASVFSLNNTDDIAPNEWVIAKMAARGVDGLVGAIVYQELEYSIDGATLWHSNFETGDYFRRERTVTVNDLDTSYGDWSSSGRVRLDGDAGFTPVKGVDYTDGIDGSFTTYVYKLSNTSVTPTGGSYNGSTETVPVGWSDNPVYSGTIKTQVSQAKYIKSGANWIRVPEWSASVQWLGQDGFAGSYITFVYQNSDTKPAKPIGGSFDGTTEVVPSNWTDDAVDSGASNTWISQARYSDNGVAWVRTTEWNEPVQWTGDNGYQSAFVQLFYLSLSSPTRPDNEITYTFADGSVSGSLDGWSKTYPSNIVAGGTVWTTFNTAFAQGGNATDVLDAVNWSVPQVLVKNGTNGSNGTNGVNGAIGVGGADGVSIVWKGDYASHPVSPQDGWAYYNTTSKRSFVRQTGAWYQMTIDGTDGQDGANGNNGNNGNDGANGISIIWKGDLSNPPSSPQVNWAYRDTDNNAVYIYTTGSAWELMVLDGNDGSNGANGSNGTNGLSVYITYHDAAPDGSAPSKPTNVGGTNNSWHTAATAESNWMSQKVDNGTTSGWGSAIRIKGVDGKDGTNGTNGGKGDAGSHGSGSYVYTTISTKAVVQAWSQATKDSHFTSAAGRAPQTNDVLSYVNESLTTGFRIDYIYKSSDWVEFTSVVNGDQIVHGTVAAEALVTATITADKIAAGAITADKLNFNPLEGDKVDGSIAGWNLDTNYIWSGTKKTSDGYSTQGITMYKGGGFRSPQFYITSTGNAYFKGALSAATGTFAGALSAATGTFAGSLSAATGTFSGSLSAATGSFSGTMSAKNIVGDITSGIVKYYAPYSRSSTGTSAAWATVYVAPRDWARYIKFPSVTLSATTSGLGSGAQCYARYYAGGSAQYSSAFIINHALDDSPTMVMPEKLVLVPANTTVTCTIKLYVSSLSGTVTITLAAASTNDGYVAFELITQGGDLS